MTRLDHRADPARVCDWTDDDFEREDRRTKRFLNAMEDLTESLREETA